jgi:hypothetical protein
MSPGSSLGLGRAGDARKYAARKLGRTRQKVNSARLMGGPGSLSGDAEQELDWGSSAEVRGRVDWWTRVSEHRGNMLGGPSLDLLSRPRRRAAGLGQLREWKG